MTDVFVESQPELFLPKLESRIDDAHEEVDKILALVDDEYDIVPGDALDVCCGIGRHVIPLAKREIEASGLDLATEYVERAERRALEENVAELTAFYDLDMRDIDELQRRFELITNLFTTYGWFSEGTNDSVLESIHERLTPGGVFVMETINKDGFLRIFEEQLITTEDGLMTSQDRDRAVLYVHSFDYDLSESRIYVKTWVLNQENREYLGDYTWNMRIYSPLDLVEKFERAGFDDVRIYDEIGALEPPNYEEPTLGSFQMTIVGRKQ